MERPPIRPTTEPQTYKLHTGLKGITAMSVQRRLFDSRFASRWFVGVGLDVGAGDDSLLLYAELFPRIINVIPFDEAQGDAQTLDNVEDDSFDFLYSSHCLEHVDDPFEAMTNWIRVVKPGGHLIVSVPDEDLYEQGTWPSRFNTTHKTTWTIDKEESWSPVSINVLDMVRRFRNDIMSLKIELIDHGHRPGLWGRGIDQTRMPIAECSIEIVLQKL
jgi:SAM-dependent methyltransferase